MGSLFGGGDKTQQTSTTSSTQYPQWTQNAGQAATGAAFAMGSPFLQVPTSAVAGYTADQLKAFDLARQSAQGAYQGGATATPSGSYQAAQLGAPQYATAARVGAPNYASAAKVGPASIANAQTLNANDISGFMNPYLRNVLDPAIDQARAEGRSTQAALGARAAASGAFGGSREAVGRALAARSANENIVSTTANMMKSGYDAAQGYAQNQATTRQQTELSNQNAKNAALLAQAGYDQQTGLSNQNAANTALLAQAGYDQQTGLATQIACIKFEMQQGQYQQQANMGNPDLALQQAQMADSMKNSDQARQLQALQQLLGNGNQQQLFGQKTLDIPWDTLQRIGQYVPNVYNASGSGTGTSPDNSPGIFQQLLGVGTSVLGMGTGGGGTIAGSLLGKRAV